MPAESGGLSGRLHLPSHFPELKLFALLKWKFGGPNGPLTFLGPPGGDPDGPFKWDFLFMPIEPLRLQIIRKTEGIELWWWGAEVERDDLVAYLEHNIEIHDAEISRAIDSLEEYSLILNPYARHKAVADIALAELQRIEIVPPTIPGAVHVDPEQLIAQVKTFQSYLQLIDRQAVFSMLLVSSSAFMVESFLNLLIAILVRTEIRNSKSVLTETLFRKWRAKLERLHIDCHGFANPVDLGDSRVRDAKQLFDIRNHIAHSYPDRSDMKIGTMWFQEQFPVLSEAVPSHQFTFALSNQLPTADEAHFAHKAAGGLIDYLRSLLTDETASMIELVSTSNPLGYNETKEIYSVPFGQAAIIAMTCY